MKQKIIGFLGVAILMGVLVSVAYALTTSEEARLVADDATGGDQLGSAVAISGDTLISTAAGAAPSGAAYIFVRDALGTWTQQQKVGAGDPMVGDYYGLSTTIWGDTAVVGSPLSVAGTVMDGGALYVYRRSGTVWHQEQKITATDAASLQSYGYSLDLEGDTLVAGSRWNNHDGLTNAGAVYVYTRSGTVWTEQQKITASDAENYDTFGFAVSVSGDTMVVGAWRADLSMGRGDAGAAYVYVRSGGHWTEQQKLTATDAAFGDYLGSSAAIEGDTIVVGAPGVDRATDMDVGALYVFTRSGTTWTQQAKLQSVLGAANDQLGQSVGFDNDVVVGGAPYADQGALAHAGAAYMFSRTGSTWSEQGRLSPSMAEAEGNFGFTASLDGTAALIGAPAEDLTVSPGYLYVVRVAGGPVPTDGGVDAGPVDAGPSDAGSSDAGVVDASDTDAAIADLGTTDAGADDAAVDAGEIADSSVDSSVEPVDMALVDDAGMQDTDSSVTSDAGMNDSDAAINPTPTPEGGCGCRVAGLPNTTNANTTGLVVLALMALLVLRRRSAKQQPTKK